MGIFDLGLLKHKEKNREFYHRHFINAINGLLASGRTDYDELIRDADRVANKALEHIRQNSKTPFFRSIGEALGFKPSQTE